jgi:hypothetical protein
MKDEAKKRREEARKRRELSKEIIDFLAPIIKDMNEWDIRDLLGAVQSRITSKFHPFRFRTFEQAISYRKSK